MHNCSHACTHARTHTHTHNRFTALQILSGTTQVSRHQKKHSPTHTHRSHQLSLNRFLHLPRSMASFLFNLGAWQSFSTISLQVFFDLSLGLAPTTSYTIHFFTKSLSSFCSTCPYHHNLDIMNLWFVLLSHNYIINRILTGPAAYVTNWDSCFMNTVLQMTKFSPSANSKLLDPSVFLSPYPKPPASHHRQQYYFQHIHSYHQLTQPFHTEVYNSTNGTLCSKTLLFLLRFPWVRSINCKNV